MNERSPKFRSHCIYLFEHNSQRQEEEGAAHDTLSPPQSQVRKKNIFTE